MKTRRGFVLSLILVAILVFIQNDPEIDLRLASAIRAIIILVGLVSIILFKTKKPKLINSDYYQNKVLDRIFNFGIIVLVASPIIIYLLTLAFSAYPDILIKSGSKDTWIGFAGSVIGGSMTVFVIIFTLRNEQNSRRAQKHEAKLERIKALMPIPNIRPICDKSQKVGIKNGFLEFELQNITKNHMFLYDVHFVEDRNIVSFHDPVDLESEVLRSGEVVSTGKVVVASDTTIKIMIDLDAREMYDKFLRTSEKDLTMILWFAVMFSDIENLQNYSMKQSVHIKVTKPIKGPFIFHYDGITTPCMPEPLPTWRVPN